MGVLTIVLLSFFAELFEVFWQYAPTIRESLERGYRVYQKSIFLFLLLHTGYLYTLFFIIKFDISSFPVILALTLKSIDIFGKLEVYKRLFMRGGGLDESMDEVLNEKTPIWLYLISPLTYPYLIFLSMN